MTATTELETLRAVNAEMLAALEALRAELHNHVKLDVRKHYSLMVAEAAAGTAIAKARNAVPVAASPYLNAPTLSERERRMVEAVRDAWDMLPVLRGFDNPKKNRYDRIRAIVREFIGE